MLFRIYYLPWLSDAKNRIFGFFCAAATLYHKSDIIIAVSSPGVEESSPGVEESWPGVEESSPGVEISKVRRV
jgi:hypothetical protein